MQLSEEERLAKYAFINNRLTRFPFLETTLQPRILVSITTVLDNKDIVDVLCFGFSKCC